VNRWIADITGIANIARDRKSKGSPRKCGKKSGREEWLTADFTWMLADQKISETLAPEREGIDEGFFEPGTEAAFGGFRGLGIVDLEWLLGSNMSSISF
jgi:hypothetical protein